MPHPVRLDEAGAWQHVMNRGIARRPVFHGRANMQFLEATLDEIVQRGDLEVHAFSTLPTHFHLFVRSVRGRLSQAIGWAENQYVRWLNRRERRDGSLFRGRFVSSRVTSDAHWNAVVRYIDRNAVAAGLVTRPPDYPWCSAHSYAQPAGPRWLARGLIESRVCEQAGIARYDPAAYPRAFPFRPEPALEWLVQRRLTKPHPGSDPWDDLIGGSSEAVQDWMARKARLADGSGAGSAIVWPEALLARIDARKREDPKWRVKLGARPKPGWDVLAAGLLRFASGLAVVEVEQHLPISHSGICRYARYHATLVSESTSYAALAAHVVADALRDCFQRDPMEQERSHREVG